MNNLAGLYFEQSRYDDAEPLYTEAVALRRRLLSDEHPQTLISMHNLAGCYESQDRLEEAELLYIELCKNAPRALPEGHWYTGVFLTKYGQLLSTLQRYDEAEEKLLEAYQILSAVFDDPEDGRVFRAVRSLVDLYDSWDKPDQAAEWRAKLPPADLDAAGIDAAPESDSP